MAKPYPEWISKELACRKIEEHLQVLVDYDVISAQVADTLTEYVWSIVGSINSVIDVDAEQLMTAWENDRNDGGDGYESN